MSRNSSMTEQQVLGEMHSKMDRTRQEWEDEVSKLKWDFFNLKPNERMTTTNNRGNDVLGSVDPSGIFIDSGMERKKFKVTFDVSQYSPNEITVRTQDNKLIVYAKHDEINRGKNISREFSRQVDIPSYVDPNTLKSTLGKDGILEVEGPACPQANGEVQSSRSHEKVSPYNSLPPLSIQGGWSSGTPSPGLSSGSPSPGIKPATLFTEKDGSRKLKMIIEVGSEFSPEEVMVKTLHRKLQISAKHEEKLDSRTTKKEYNKELELPDDVDPNAVTASMTLDGKLILEAPMSNFTQGSYQGKPGSNKQPEVRVSFQ